MAIIKQKKINSDKEKLSVILGSEDYCLRDCIGTPTWIKDEVLPTLRARLGSDSIYVERVMELIQQCREDMYNYHIDRKLQMPDLEWNKHYDKILVEYEARQNQPKNLFGE